MYHTNQGFTAKSLRKLLARIVPASFSDLLLLMEADCSGRPPCPRGLPRRMIPLLDLAVKEGVDLVGHRFGFEHDGLHQDVPELIAA